MSNDYRVQLDVFSGPLDLLLFLIKREELDIQDIAITRVTEQYLEYCRVLEALDPNAAGEFLVLASTLIELKSRALLPSPPLLDVDDEDDPRSQLVKQLLEYKRFKDAAKALGSAADERAHKVARRPADLPVDLKGVELEEVAVWDLVEAFGRVMQSIGAGPKLHDVTFDELPIETYVERIAGRLRSRPTTRFTELFEDAGNRGEVIGLFLALLEMMRHQRIRVEQEKLHGEIYVFLLSDLEVEEPDEAVDAPAVPYSGPRLVTDSAEFAGIDEAGIEEADDERR